MSDEHKTGGPGDLAGEGAGSCDRCGHELGSAEGLCPECDEPAPGWMVYLVYALAGLFLAGLVYRLVFP